MELNNTILIDSTVVNEKPNFFDTPRIWLKRRQFSKLLNLHADIKFSTLISPEVNALPENHDSDGFGKSLLTDFSSPLKHLVEQRLGLLEGLITTCGEQLVNECRAEVAIQSRRLAQLSDEYHDIQQVVREVTDERPPQLNPPEPVEQLQAQLRQRADVNSILRQITDLRQKAFRNFLGGIALELVEIIVISLSLYPVFENVPGVAFWMLPALALSIIIMTTLAGFYIINGKIGARILSIVTLAGIAFCLTVLRLGVILNEQTNIMTNISLALLFSVPIPWLAIFEAKLFEKYSHLRSEAHKLWLNSRNEVNEILTLLQANQEHRQAQREFDTRSRFLRNSERRRLERRLRQLEDELRAIVAHIYKYLHSKRGEALKKIGPEIRYASDQLARWYYSPLNRGR